MVSTFHLHCLGHKIKYGNPGVGNTTQQFLSTTRPCCSIEFIESFLFWVIIITYNTGIYICVYIYKISYIHSFFFLLVIFNFNVFSALHAKHLDILKNILWNMWLLHSTIHQVIWCFCVFIVNPLSLLWSFFFFSRKLCFLWSPCLLLIAESFSLDTSDKPTVGFSWKLFLALV